MRRIFFILALLIPVTVQAQPSCTSAAPNAIACNSQAVSPQPTDLVLGQQATGPNRQNQSVKFSLAQIAGTPSVANLAALKALSAGIYPYVYRAGYGSAGDGGAAVYTWSTAACSLNSGAGDNGSQVAPTAGTGCWLASFGPDGADVRVFGADATGTVDSKPAILAAQVAGKVVVPCGTFLLASAFTATADDFGGQSSACSILKTTFASGDAVTMGTEHAGLHDLQFVSSVTRTGGSYVTVNVPYQWVERVLLKGAAIGIHVGSGGTLSVIRDVQALDTVAVATYSKSTGFLVDGAPESVFIDNPFCNYDSTTNIPRSCMELVNADALVLQNPNLIHGQANLLVDPGSGQSVSSTQIIAGFLDTAQNHGLELNATGTGVINRMTVTGTWFGDSVTGEGIYFNSGGGVTAGFYCENCYGVNNATWFANIASAQWSNIQFIGGCTSNNGTGNFTAAASVEFVQIQGFNHNTTACAGSPSPIGIQIGSGSSNWRISGNNLVGVATPISGASNLASGRIETNTGYNPVGNVSVTVPSSGSTLVNGPSPSTLFISGGTVSGIVLNGTATGQTSGAFPLAPFQGITVTYSVAPNMTMSVQ